MSVTAATRRSYDAVAAQYDVAIGGELAGQPIDRPTVRRRATPPRTPSPTGVPV